MGCLLRRRLLALGALAFIASGCASLQQPPRQLELQRPNETLARSATGRFVLQSQNPLAEPVQGSQGRFEWLEYQSGSSLRRVLIVVGPFGQSLGGIEETIAPGQPGSRLYLFDDQGRLTTPERGNDLPALQSLMRFIESRVGAYGPVHETEIVMESTPFRLRIAFDAQ